MQPCARSGCRLELCGADCAILGHALGVRSCGAAVRPPRMLLPFSKRTWHALPFGMRVDSTFTDSNFFTGNLTGCECGHA